MTRAPTPLPLPTDADAIDWLYRRCIGVERKPESAPNLLAPGGAGSSPADVSLTARRTEGAVTPKAGAKTHLEPDGSVSASPDGEATNPSPSLPPPEPPSGLNTCPYCAGKGGRITHVYSRFLGTEPQIHDGPWETCWSCKGSGQDA